MEKHKVVSSDAWLKARKALLAKEKEFTRQRDALAEERRRLPWERVDKAYAFEGPKGRETLAELFEGRRQLIVYHFMFGPDWEEGCPSCSYMADHYDPAIVHLNQRDVTMIAVSNTSLDKIDAFKRRMGWTFKWVSSMGSDFNRDYQVTFTEDELNDGEVTYNYGKGGFPSTEAPGISVFYRDDDGQVFHTYSCYARGLDMFLTAYHYLDLVPKGRDEDQLSFTMEWVRHHDRYDT